MDASSGVNSVLLLDNFNEESQMLYQAFKASGFQGKVVTMEDDGFLPEDVISLYHYFCGNNKGKPRYFNQINVPDYWEIESDNTTGKVMNLSKKRGMIYYTKPTNKRLVRVVDWMNEEGIVRSSDHYDCYGALYARTTFNKKGQRFCKTYYDTENREVIVENYVTGDIVLNYQDKVFMFHSKVDFCKKLFEIADIQYDSIYYNSLSHPFFVSESLTSDVKRDVLFWQEDVRDDIPGNMQSILNGTSSRTATIFVQKKESYEKFIQLGVSTSIVKPLGFVYDYQGECNYGNDILICTNSDQIENIHYLVEHLSNMHFHIAAITEMSSTLLEMAKYKNVSLYPNVKTNKVEELFHKCDYYFDINHSNEILLAVKNAFLNNQLIVGFSNTLHDVKYIAKEHVFTNVDQMVQFINRVNNDHVIFQNELNLQKNQAMAEESAKYKEVFNR